MAYKLLHSFKPDVIFLTTGSGNKDEARIHESIKLIESIGLKAYRPFEPFSDRQIYDLILEGKHDAFVEVKSALEQFILGKKYNRIFGDALEGFNPSHDLCRYLINASVRSLQDNLPLENYSFLQDELFKCSEIEQDKEGLVLNLNVREVEAKLNACREYSQLKHEVDRFIERFGVEFFNHEYFRKLSQTDMIKNWENEAPFYEIHGRKRVEEGVYKHVISFDNHMKPLAKLLLNIP